MSASDCPTGTVDDWGTLTIGYADPPNVASTVTFIQAGSQAIIHDPGLVRDRSMILAPLRKRGIGASDVTDVIISHHHPDHTLNVALFENARTHDVWGIYKDDQWVVRRAEGVDVAPGVKLVETPGHTTQDITVLVNTRNGLVALTHLWWNESFPMDHDPTGVDDAALHASRARILALNPVLIVPGHGAAFEPTSDTPR